MWVAVYTTISCMVHELKNKEEGGRKGGRGEQVRGRDGGKEEEINSREIYRRMMYM